MTLPSENERSPVVRKKEALIGPAVLLPSQPVRAERAGSKSASANRRLTAYTSISQILRCFAPVELLCNALRDSGPNPDCANTCLNAEKQKRRSVFHLT